MKKLLLLLEHKIIKIGLIIVIVLAGFFLFYEQEIKEKAVNVSQGKFPTSSYLFQAYEGIKNKIDTINEVKPNDETKSVNENIKKTQKDLDDFNALVQKLPDLPKDFNKTLIKPQSPSFNYNTANEEEKTRLVILASRISSQKETQPPTSIKNSVSNTKSKEKQELEKEYGSSGFKNFKRKNVASSENKLLRTITADRMIPAILITPISSEIGGSKIVAQVESDIYATMGRAVLIPKGSRAIGYYNSNNKIGEYRLEIAWNRIITPQGVNIILSDAKGADVKGYNGMIGTLHNKYWERYGIPLSLSTLSNGLLIGLTSGLTEAMKNKKGGFDQNYFGDYMMMQMTRQTGISLNNIIAQIMREQIRIKPIITIREGSHIFISPNTDIWFPIPKNNEVLAKFFNEEKEQNNDTK
ncbi:hypothetical protein HpBTM70_00060 [Helicobacter pylori]